MSDFELVAPPDDVKPVGARVSTKALYDEWIDYCQSSHFGVDHPYTKEAYAKYKRALEAEG